MALYSEPRRIRLGNARAKTKSRSHDSAVCESEPDSPVLGLEQFKTATTQYSFECEMQGQSPRTITQKKEFLALFVMWYETYESQSLVSDRLLKNFFHYLVTSHTLPEGRWNGALSHDKGIQKRAVKQLSVYTRRLFRNYLKGFFNWVVNEGMLDENPVDSVPTIKIPDEQKEPLSDAEVKALLNAAKRSPHPRRDTALLRFLLSTGCRASEATALTWQDLDIEGGTVIVRGKGNKRRTVYFGKRTRAALWQWKMEVQRELNSDGDVRGIESMPICMAVAGQTPGQALCRVGLLRLIKRLGKGAGIKRDIGVHLLRHTFARIFLERGGQEKALQRLLGHRHLTVTHQYVNLNDAQLAKQHARYDPGDAFD